MGNELPEGSPQNIWLNQPMETRTMTLKLVQQRSRGLRVKTRSKLLRALAIPLAVGLIYGLGMKEFAPLRQTLQPLFGFAFAWSLAGLYFLSRGLWSTELPVSVDVGTGLDSCMREIDRQRDLQRRVLLWSFGPVLLAIGTFILALAMVGSKDRSLFPNGLPFLILVVVWIVAFFVIRLREQQELQRESEELINIARENRGQ